MFCFAVCVKGSAQYRQVKSNRKPRDEAQRCAWVFLFLDRAINNVELFVCYERADLHDKIYDINYISLRSQKRLFRDMRSSCTETAT